MNATTTQDADSDVNPIELAIPIARRVEFEAIVLTDCRATRAVDIDPSTHGLSLSVEITNVEIGIDREKNRFSVRPFFKLTAVRDAEPEPLLSLEAAFALIYNLDSFDGVEDTNVSAFAKTNGVFNAWPYWREFVQNTLSRMGIQGVVVPLFKL